jgi:hypothetical protein
MAAPPVIICWRGGKWMPDLEGVGEAVTGGLMGRAVEPIAGEADGHTHEKSCLNCGAALAGPYCHACGQKAHIHRTLSAFWHDIAHGVFHFEGKIFRTLPMLAWHPGVLTRRYIEGERATFVSPIALFLFSAFLMFAVFSLTGGLGKVGNPSQQVAEQKAAATARLAKLEVQRVRAVREGEDTARIEERIAEKKAELAILEKVRVGTAPKVSVDSSDAPDFLKGWIDEAGTNPELLFYKLKTNAYKFSWALIPLSVPFVWLLFPFSRKFTFYDHTVFVTYSLCFMMLLLIVGSTVGLVLPFIGALAWFMPPVHMYRQLKEAYALSRAGALWRTLALTIFAFIAIGLFMTIIAGVGTVE